MISIQPPESVLSSRLPLSAAVTLFDQVVSNAFLAALTARSTSALDACWISSRGLFVAGFIVENVSPDEDADHSLLLHDLAMKLA